MARNRLWFWSMLQVNLFRKHLFLHQLTHNMKKDCSWNYHENYKLRTLAEHVQNMFLPTICSLPSINLTTSLSTHLVLTIILLITPDLEVTFGSTNYITLLILKCWKENGLHNLKKMIMLYLCNAVFLNREWQRKSPMGWKHFLRSISIFSQYV